MLKKEVVKLPRDNFYKSMIMTSITGFIFPIVYKSEVGYMQNLINGSNKYYFPTDKLPNDYAIVFHKITTQWLISRDLMLKLLGFKIPIKYHQFLIKGLSPQALYLKSIYELCERVHGMCDDIPYQNAGVWFSKVFMELIGFEIDKSLTPIEKIPLNNNYKKYMADELSRESKQLRIGENPYKDNNEYGFSLLIDCSIELSQINLDFKRTRWKSFLSSFSAHIAERQSIRWARGFLQTDENNNKTYRLCGGRGRY